MPGNLGVWKTINLSVIHSKVKASITHGALVPRTEDHVTTCLTLSMVCTPYYPHSTPYGIIEGLISSILCHDADVQL